MGGAGSRYRARRGGVTLIETAIGLPLFLAAVLIVVWLALTYNAESALSSAVGNAVRLAVTRGNRILMGFDPQSAEGLIDPLEAFHLSGVWTPEVKRLLASGDRQDDAAAVYDAWAAEVFGVGLNQLPPQYLYALAYTNQYMRAGVGAGVRFPCDPGLEPPRGGAGCMACRFINPDYSRARGIGLYSPYDGAAPIDRFGMVCEYAPDLVLVRPILELLRPLAGGRALGLRLRRQAFYNIPGAG